MFTCPCCEERGVGLFAKLLSNPSHPAICRFCRAEVSKSASTVRVQLALGLVCAAITANYHSLSLAVALTAVIVLVGLLGPTDGIPP